MKWLAALMSGLGLMVGTVFAIAIHHAHAGATGWTSYVALNQNGYADYLPKHGPGWFPALVIYPMVGALIGLAIAVLLAWSGFRLTRISAS